PSTNIIEGTIRIVGYTIEYGLDLLTAPGIPIYNRGNIIDLTFSNIPLYSTKVTLQLDYGSNYSIYFINIFT
ncbi:hypothetical protein QR685DRAFT_438406, partial [Neurospora intermedia]